MNMIWYYLQNKTFENQEGMRNSVRQNSINRHTHMVVQTANSIICAFDKQNMENIEYSSIFAHKEIQYF